MKINEEEIYIELSNKEMIIIDLLIKLDVVVELHVMFHIFLQNGDWVLLLLVLLGMICMVIEFKKNWKVLE